MTAASSQVIGVDLGGTKIKAALISQDGKLGEHCILPSQVARGPDVIIEDICQMVRKLDPEGSCSIGIGVAGQVDGETGGVSFAPNLKWRNVPLRATLEQTLHQPITVLNDVRAHTWGEWLFGAGRDCDDLVCLFIGTGVGGGIVSGGRMITGSSNMAGELGHLVVDPSGPVCGCGNKGCLEAWVSGIHLETQAREYIQNNVSGSKELLKLANNQLEKVSGKILGEAYRSGDPAARAVLNRAAEALIIGAVNIVHAYNPRRLILGGGVIQGFPHLVAEVRNGIRERALPAASKDLIVVEAQLGNDAGIIGAGAVALRTR